MKARTDKRFGGSKGRLGCRSQEGHRRGSWRKSFLMQAAQRMRREREKGESRSGSWGKEDEEVG